MSATDYHICPALTSAYIAKVRKNPSLMFGGEITEKRNMLIVGYKRLLEGRYFFRFTYQDWEVE